MQERCVPIKLIAFKMVHTIKYFIHILNTQMHTHMHAYILTALQCDCNDQFLLSDCRHNGWTCTAREGTGACATRVRLLSNGNISRETRCLDMRLNPFHCSGRYNTDTDVWVCCNDTDYCNRDLSPTLNLPAPTQTLAASSSSAADVIVRIPSVQAPSERVAACFLLLSHQLLRHYLPHQFLLHLVRRTM